MLYVIFPPFRLLLCFIYLSVLLNGLEIILLQVIMFGYKPNFKLVLATTANCCRDKISCCLSVNRWYFSSIRVWFDCIEIKPDWHKENVKKWAKIWFQALVKMSLYISVGLIRFLDFPKQFIHSIVNEIAVIETICNEF